MLFIEKANTSVDEVSEQVKRTRIWLQSEQKLNLQREIHRKNKEMELVEAEFYSARLADATERKSGIQMRLRRLKQEIREIEEKIRAVQAWTRHYDSNCHPEPVTSC